MDPKTKANLSKSQSNVSRDEEAQAPNIGFIIVVWTYEKACYLFMVYKQTPSICNLKHRDPANEI